MRALTFSGILSETGFELDPGFVIDGEPAKPEGSLVVHAIGRRAEVAAATRLALVEPCLPGGERNAAAVRVATGLVPFPETAIGLRVSLEGRELLELTASREPLRAEVDWPRELAGRQELRWRPSQRGCAAVLGYSNDDGRQWAPLSAPTVSDVVAFDATYLPGGAGRLELRVSDGLRTISLRSDPYNVQPKGWVLWVLAPSDGAAVAADLPVVLAAQAYHIEERSASLDGIHWSSSVDGDLGTGGWVRPVLSTGDHRITATANGRSVEVSVRVE
jgi:hypothetical protein